MKNNNIKSLLNLALLAILLSGCTMSKNESSPTTKVEKPVIDIHTAVLSGNLEAVKQHIAAGTDINEQEPFNYSTPLISAATFGKIEIAKALIDAGADLKLKNKDGSTALHSAAFFCRIEIVQMLLDAKADKQIKNNYGATPRETVLASFADMKSIYELLQKQLGPLGLDIDLSELEEARPVVAMMLQ